VSLTVIGLLIPFNDPHLVGSQAHSTRASPFVLSIQNAGIRGLDSVMNAIILVAVISVGNSAVYGSTRTLAALAEQNQAPRMFAYIDRAGRPLVAIILAALVGLLAYLAVTPAQVTVFNWLLALSGLSSILTWGSICLAHLRFRQAWKHFGHSLDDLAFTSQAGVWGSRIGIGINVLIIMAQFWTGFAPIGWRENTPLENASSFFQAFLCVPVVLFCYLYYKIRYRTSIVPVAQMDICTGMRDPDLRELLEEERIEQRSWPRWKRWYRVVC